jgi:hypothetical protein
MHVLQIAQFWVASFSLDPATWVATARALEAFGLLIIGDEPREDLIPAYLTTSAFVTALLAPLLYLLVLTPELSWAGAEREVA